MLCLLVACTNAPTEDQDAPVPDVPVAETPLEWAGYYDGTLPCADCPGIETTLWIYSDGSYVLQEKYLDRDTWRNGHIGTWKAVQGGVELAHARDGGPMRWAAVGDDLRLADADGGPMPGDLPYTIEKLADEIIDEVPRMYIRGIHRIAGESHSFEPCGSGRNYPLAVGGHLEALMKARKQSGVAADAPLTMRILATMRYAEAMEGEEDDLYIWLQEAPQLLKGQGCP